MSESTPATLKQEQLVSPAEYQNMLQTRVITSVLTQEQLQKLKIPEYQRSVIAPQVKNLRMALRRGEFLPDIILSRRPAPEAAGSDGKKKNIYLLVDGLQRATAAKEEGYPLRATIIEFGAVEREQDHFVKFQRSRRVNANLICRINDADPVNREVVSIAEDKGHPLFKRIWFGVDTQTPDCVPATVLANSTKKGLAVEDLSEFAHMLATLFELGPKATILKSGGIRGAIHLFYYLRDEADYNSSDPEHAAAFADFDWENQTVADSARINSPAPGKIVGDKLIAHWKEKISNVVTV